VHEFFGNLAGRGEVEDHARSGTMSGEARSEHHGKR
jgi:hypothetical protein